MPGPAAQSYIERPPVAGLAGLVSSVWIQQVAPGAQPYTQRNIPSGGVELVCHVGGVPRIAGPLTRAVVEVMEPGTTVVGMRLHPGAAPSVLGLPASELVDRTLGSDELWATPLSRWASTPTPPRRQSRRSRACSLRSSRGWAARLRPTRSSRRRCGSCAGARTTSASLTSSLHISERQLRRRFQAATGLAPKTLHRVLRFQRFLALAQHAIARGESPTGDGLARLAAEAGYADQPHLNRECLRLTGATPGAFVGEAEDHCGCGHDHAASYMPVLRSRALAHA